MIFLREQKICVTERKFFCIDMYGRVSLWARKQFPLVRYRSRTRTVSSLESHQKEKIMKETEQPQQ